MFPKKTKALGRNADSNTIFSCHVFPENQGPCWERRHENHGVWGMLFQENQSLVRNADPEHHGHSQGMSFHRKKPLLGSLTRRLFSGHAFPRKHSLLLVTSTRTHCSFFWSCFPRKQEAPAGNLYPNTSALCSGFSQKAKAPCQERRPEQIRFF